ncbi:Rrf2 family transcriptional regulator, partial [Verrucomicrobiales bacterium]|nr:Rrf2 family transcriptional regulator [Verrucomicrobiales bacterium]
SIHEFVGNSDKNSVFSIMELNQFTDYSLRALIFVALKNGELASVKEISSAFSISENHLVKVVHNLAKLGYLETFRGRSGGMRLAKKPSEIGVGEVVRAVESMAVVECISPRKGTCCIKGVCELQMALGRATAAFLAELDKLTLADLVTNEQELKARMV